MVEYKLVEEHIPELKGNRYHVIILGYEMCPFSAKALRAVNSHKKWQNNYKFIPYQFGGTGALKQATQYNGTFPIVFVRNESGDLEHIGGGTELENLAKQA